MLCLKRKNGAEHGQVKFETQIYDRAGVYEYTQISEKNDGQKKCKQYGRNRIQCNELRLQDNGKGNLIAEAVYTETQDCRNSFNNICETPKSGENRNRPKPPRL